MAQDVREQEAFKKWGQVVSRAWSDPTFKKRLLADPKAVLVEAGMPIPTNLSVEVHESTPTHYQLVLPPPPPGRHGDMAELTEAELKQVAGGSTATDVAYCFFNPIGSFVKTWL